MGLPKKTKDSWPLIFIVAGEASGDLFGAQLIKALREEFKGKVRFVGIGGDLMQKEGFQSFFPLSDFGIMGFFEDWRKYFRIISHLYKTVRYVKDLRPDVVLTIDFPGFNFQLGKRLKKLDVVQMHYVAPTVWAWKQNRAKKISKFLQHLFTLFSFEPPYFEVHGLPTTFVGHPLVEMDLSSGKGKIFRKKYRIPEKATLVSLFPGSRMGELDRHLTIFRDAVELLKEKIPDLWVVIPTLPFCEDYLKCNWISSVPTVFVTDFKEKKDAYAASDVALAASGTVALELALARLPMIITYKISKISAWIVKMFVKTKYFCMINILLKRKAIPELLQEQCTPQKLSSALLTLLRDPLKRKEQLKSFKELDSYLIGGKVSPTYKIAETIRKAVEGS
jgi:lipid-A-disaccharide synthase